MYFRPGMTYAESLAARREEIAARKAAKEANLKKFASIIADLNTVFVELDAKMLANQKEWAKGRRAALAKFKDSPEVAERRKQKDFSWWYYPEMFKICGGKTWYNILSRGDWEAAIEKNCKAIADSRNAKIAQKLSDLGVEEVTESKIERSNDGFHGFFKVATNTGERTIRIETIYAGGYNIQCFHQRTLVKVK